MCYDGVEPRNACQNIKCIVAKWRNDEDNSTSITSSYKYLGNHEEDGIKHHDSEGKDKKRVLAASEKHIGFKAKFQKQNVDNKLARSRGISVWYRNPKVVRGRVKRDEREVKKTSNNAWNLSCTCRH